MIILDKTTGNSNKTTTINYLPEIFSLQFSIFSAVSHIFFVSSGVGVGLGMNEIWVLGIVNTGSLGSV